MNLPNKLTMLRVIMIPFFVFFLLTEVAGACSPWVALALFCVASLTDFFDGQIARKYNLVTNFGKFMDPLADKLLVCSALICFIELRLLPAWFVIIIIAREFIISGFRLVASDNGVVIAASWWGKFKTVSQMLMIILLILFKGIHAADGTDLFWRGCILRVWNAQTAFSTIDWTMASLLISLVAWIALILTVVSLIDYLVKNWKVMGDQK